MLFKLHTNNYQLNNSRNLLIGIGLNLINMFICVSSQNLFYVDFLFYVLNKNWVDLLILFFIIKKVPIHTYQIPTYIILYYCKYTYQLFQNKL